MKILKEAFEAFMGLALRLVLGTFLFTVGMVFLILIAEGAIMDREAKEYLKWLAIVALIIVVANMVACTRVVYREVPGPTPYVFVNDVVFEPCDSVGLCTWAKTTCSEQNTPVVFVRRSKVTPEEYPFTKAHEKMHVTQMSGNCKKTLGGYMDSLVVRERMESQAYCAEAHARLQVTRNVQAVGMWYASMLKALFETDSLACSLKPP